MFLRKILQFHVGEREIRDYSLKNRYSDKSYDSRKFFSRELFQKPLFFWRAKVFNRERICL